MIDWATGIALDDWDEYLAMQERRYAEWRAMASRAEQGFSECVIIDWPDDGLPAPARVKPL